MRLLTEFLLDRIAEQPVAQRVMLYRALAVETKDKDLAKVCRELADELEQIERRHAKLQLSLKLLNP